MSRHDGAEGVMKKARRQGDGPCSDEHFLGEALSLARKGEGRVSPNPMVGAVLVREGRVLSRGYHRRFGGPHAEVEALMGQQGDLRDATLYVNLEPCCHHGKTPPCTELITRLGVGRVVIGTLDPNPLVAGRGVRVLREAGVDVRVGVMEEPCRRLNRVFFHWMESGLPWVTLKWAQSLDGRIATRSGHSRWISSERSLRMAHRLRALHDAVLVGIGTVLADDPELTVRLARGRDPIRVVLDSRLRIPMESKLLRLSAQGPETWIVTAPSSDRQKARELERRGVRLIETLQGPGEEVDLREMLRGLARSGVSSVLVEGGGRVITSFLKARLVQRLVCFVAPIVLGRGKSAVRSLDVARVEDALRLHSWRVRRLGPDLMIDASFGGVKETEL